ncbi:MAG: segregation/condensation protein A [Alphaproteobacteria bacterium]|nr:segregation/condensation protein A [Alphaproteobacteria bacterium]MCB9791767.1 segregation/condensation protein A [Alphaproteobacteria bacterium]
MHTEVYDGPLELLLYLIRRDGIDVRNIPIAHVTAEYLRYLDMMTQLDLDLAGDFLLMASTLCQLKSRELIPRPSVLEEEEEEDPKEALARRLIEYERYKEAAEKLEERPLLGRDHYARPPQVLSADERPIDPGVDAFGLLEAFYDVLDRAAEAPPVHEIEMEEYSMAERVRWVLDRLKTWEGATLRRLFLEIPTRSQRILTFLAVLEMARFQIIDVRQAAHLGEVELLARAEAAEADLSAISDSYTVAAAE